MKGVRQIVRLFSKKTKKIADVVTIIYGVFISVIITVAIFSKIYFYDLLAVWVIGASIVSVIYIVSAILSLRKSTLKQKELTLLP